jgi:VIT1/CCC1 family predicted Fe2+/Mn2+ transporter
MDLINRIAFKLGQYNQALTSFNKLVQELDIPDPAAIEHYRAYLETEKPVMENETKFLEAPGDLVVLGRKAHHGDADRPRSKPHVRFEQPVPQKAGTDAGADCPVASAPSPPLQIIAIAVATAVLVPILTFAVIPGFLGRITVVMLVASATVGFLIQSGIASQGDLLGGGKEMAACAMIYGSVMVVVAGIFA